MSDDPQLPAWARPRIPPAAGRPLWVVLLALAMLVFGGRLLINGVSQLAGPGVERTLQESSSAQVTQDLQALGESLAQAYRAHPMAVRVNAASKVVMGLLLLFAVAALFASDRRARRATMLAAWAGIAYQIGDAIFLFQIFRKGMVAVAPVLVNLAARQTTADKVPTASALISMIDILIVGLGVLGILFSVVLLTFFGGRRGRTFFGVGPDLASRQPHHGG
jgi:hypothetical protein